MSPEMVLVAACCRWPSSPARDAAVRLAAAGVDWDGVWALIERHRVAPLAYAALTAARIVMPKAHAHAMLVRIVELDRLTALMAAESARLQALFDAAGIASLVIKGAPLAVLAYGATRVKASKDIDLLIEPARVVDAIGLLQAEGYRLGRPARALSAAQLAAVIRYDREVELIHPAHGKLQVELQWGLSRNRHVLPGLDARAPFQTVALGAGQAVRTLRTDDLFAYLCVHGAAHGWFRLKWLADVAAFARDDAERLYRAAQARGVGDAAAQALLLAADLLALDLPAGLAAELALRRKVRVMVRAARDLLVGPGAEHEVEKRRFGQAKVQYAEWLTVRDARDLRAAMGRYMVATGDVLAVPLPRRWYWLYPLLRVPLGIARRFRRR